MVVAHVSGASAAPGKRMCLNNLLAGIRRSLQGYGEEGEYIRRCQQPKRIARLSACYLWAHQYAFCRDIRCIGRMSRLLFPDRTGHGGIKLIHQSSFALAGLVPASLLVPTESIPAKIVDVGLSVVLPVHGYFGLMYSEWSRRDALGGLLMSMPQNAGAEHTLLYFVCLQS